MRHTRIYLIGFVIFALTYSASAQPGPPPDPDPTTPITGIEILIGIGSLFGAKKLINDARRKKH